MWVLDAGDRSIKGWCPPASEAKEATDVDQRTRVVIRWWNGGCQSCRLVWRGRTLEWQGLQAGSCGVVSNESGDLVFGFGVLLGEQNRVRARRAVE